jgi:hypothetical protein
VRKPLKPKYNPTLAERAYLSQYEEGTRYVWLHRMRNEPDMLPDVALVAEIQRSIDDAVREAKG